MSERGSSYEGAPPPSDNRAPSGERRVALVIGNANYKYGAPLRNPHQDAEAIAGLLTRLGFELTVSPTQPDQHWHADLDLISMKRLIADFGIATERADMAVVYFAGHGLEVDGQNYLLPIDAELEHVRRVRAEATSLSELLDEVDGVKHLPLVILDACRDNPFAGRMRGLDGTRSFRSGLAEIEPSGDVLVAYAARQGLKAQDGPEGGNSPYAEALVEHLVTPDVDLRILLGRVRDTVRDKTSHMQHPHFSGSLGGKEIYLARTSKQRPEIIPAASAQKGSTRLALAEREWELLKNATDIVALKEFANDKDFETTYYARLAEKRIAHLEEAVKEEATASAETPRETVPIPQEKPSTPHVNRLGDQAKSLPWGLIGLGSLTIAAVAALVILQPWKPQPGTTFRDCTNCPEMIIVPAGSFLMGSSKGEAYHNSDEEGPGGKPLPVTIEKPFAVGKFEVTFAEWDACVATGGCNGYKPLDNWGRGKQPVINVSWHDAQAYVRWLSKKTGKQYRLLAEAEWEYAARGVTSTSQKHTTYWWGNNFDTSKVNNDGTTVSVGRYAANRFGLHDMHGNVWEWVEDCYHENYKKTPTDGSANTSGNCIDLVLRGGSWSNDPRSLRSAARNRSWTDRRSSSLGFRVARTL